MFSLINSDWLCDVFLYSPTFSLPMRYRKVSPKHQFPGGNYCPRLIFRLCWWPISRLEEQNRALVMQRPTMTSLRRFNLNLLGVGSVQEELIILCISLWIFSLKQPFLVYPIRDLVVIVVFLTYFLGRTASNNRLWTPETEEAALSFPHIWRGSWLC